MRDSRRPAAVTQRMHLYQDSIPPFVQLQRARPAWRSKVPMMAAGASGQLTLASNHDAPPPALLEGLLGGEIEIEFEHGCLSS